MCLQFSSTSSRPFAVPGTASTGSGCPGSGLKCGKAQFQIVLKIKSLRQKLIEQKTRPPPSRSWGLPGVIHLNSSLKAWRIRIEYHKLPTVKSRLRLEQGRQSYSPSKPKRELVHQRDEFWLEGNALSRASINPVFKLSHVWLKKMNGSCVSEFKFPMLIVTSNLSFLSVLILHPYLRRAGRRIGFPVECMYY